MNESQFVKKYRDKLNLTQGELGEKLGVTAQFVSNVEHGLNEIPPRKVKAFCEATGASMFTYFRIKLEAERRKLKMQIYHEPEEL